MGSTDILPDRHRRCGHRFVPQRFRSRPPWSGLPPRSAQPFASWPPDTNWNLCRYSREHTGCRPPQQTRSMSAFHTSLHLHESVRYADRRFRRSCAIHLSTMNSVTKSPGFLATMPISPLLKDFLDDGKSRKRIGPASVESNVRQPPRKPVTASSRCPWRGSGGK
jgi:hypothetical protein